MEGDPVLNQALSIANGKGGVGKTSLTANIAAIAAHSGWEVLVVDLDPQGNLGADLGYHQLGLSDDGAALSRAIQFGEPLVPPVRRIRRHLDAIPAGTLTHELARVLQDRGARASAEAFDSALAPLVGEYDLIVFDCPPGDDVLGRLGLAMASGLVIPIRFDSGSLDGLELMAARMHEVASSGINPALRLLGIALFDVSPGATALRRQVLEELDMDFSRGVRVFETAIRHSQRAAYDMRQDGLVAIEYELVANRERRDRLALLRRGKEVMAAAGPPKSRSAAGLAADYTALANEILEVFSAPLAVNGETVTLDLREPDMATLRW